MSQRMEEPVAASREQHAARSKTKRELKEAQRAERQTQTRKLTIGAVYKRLVKVRHPDLERDAEARERKSAVMQQVTTAYADGDLHTLLRLECEWIDGDAPGASQRSDEILDGYAQVHRAQVSQLRFEHMDLQYHPRYDSLMGDDPSGAPDLIDGPAEVRELDAEIEAVTAGLARLSDPRTALREVRSSVRESREVQRGPRW